jgi:sulfur-oxidizing protein SoxY
MNDLELDRRTLLRSAGGGILALGGMTLFAGSATAATPEAVQKLMAELTGGKTPAEGKVKIEMPQIAENGNAVPVTVSVDSPMTDADHVKWVHIVAEANPDPSVAAFTFTPASGKAQVSTRMRLARTQNVVALAGLSDGSVHIAKTEVKVTIGGCGG